MIRSPSSYLSRPPIIFSKVDFPDPDLPNTKTIPVSPIDNETLSSALTGSPFFGLYVLLKFFN